MEAAAQFDEQIYALIRKAAPDRCKKVKITNETALQKELGLDSLAILALVFRFEEAFGIDLRRVDLDVARLRTVGDLVDTGRQVLHQLKAD